MSDDLDPDDDLQRIVESARRLGIELDEQEALWQRVKREGG